MLAELLAAFPGSRLRPSASGVTGPVCVGGVFHELRVRFDPVVELFVGVPALDGFELEVHHGDRWFGDTRIGDAEIDDGFFIRTNDPGLARTWLDAPARALLRGVSPWLAAHDLAEAERLAARRDRDDLDASARSRWRMWPVHLQRETIALSRGTAGGSADELVHMVELACVIAGAPQRWADRLAAAAALTGAEVRDVVDRISLGSRACTLELPRGTAEVRYLRRAPGGAEGRLVTRVMAFAPERSTQVWAIHAHKPAAPLPALPRGVRVIGLPPLDGLPCRASARGVAIPFPQLVPLFTRLSDPAIAATLEDDGAAVWFEGAVVEPEPLALAARLVVEVTHGGSAAVGPYR